uniref:Uncharacterized protein n=1 Tax=Micrurus surinamensis TaxID=129470 RepID=A0A2D4Q333_MICSU
MAPISHLPLPIPLPLPTQTALGLKTWKPKTIIPDKTFSSSCLYSTMQLKKKSGQLKEETNPPKQYKRKKRIDSLLLGDADGKKMTLPAFSLILEIKLHMRECHGYRGNLVQGRGGIKKP